MNRWLFIWALLIGCVAQVCEAGPLRNYQRHGNQWYAVASPVVQVPVAQVGEVPVGFQLAEGAFRLAQFNPYNRPRRPLPPGPVPSGPAGGQLPTLPEEEVGSADAEPMPTADGIVSSRGPIDVRLLRGLLGRYESKLASDEARLPRRGAEAQKAELRVKRGILRNFLSSDYNVDILAWQIDTDPSINLEPMPDTGNKLNDWMTWFITNIDEIIEAIKKILALFEGMNPPVGNVEPMQDWGQWAYCERANYKELEAIGKCKCPSRQPDYCLSA